MQGGQGINQPSYTPGNGGNSKFTADIPVILAGGRVLGRYVNGTVIPAIGKTAEEVFNDIAQEPIPPSIGMNLAFGTLFQKGLPVANVQVNHSIALGTGVVLLRKILKNNTIINNPATNNGSYTHTGQNIIWSDSAADRTYKFQVDYTAFATQTAQSTINFVAPSYYGVGTSTLLDTVTTVAGLNSALPSSQELRTSRSRGATSFSPTLQRYFFAYPAALGNLASIIDQNGFNVTAGFALTTKLITLADGSTELYNIYISTNDTTQSNFLLTFN